MKEEPQSRLGSISEKNGVKTENSDVPLTSNTIDEAMDES